MYKVIIGMKYTGIRIIWKLIETLEWPTIFINSNKKMNANHQIPTLKESTIDLVLFKNNAEIIQLTKTIRWLIQPIFRFKIGEIDMADSANVINKLTKTCDLNRTWRELKIL